MSKKPQLDQPADDWAGLAQNLFGINLDKSTGDEDLLDEDMFKVELSKPPEPPASIPQSEVEFAPAAESEAASPTPTSPPVVATKPPVKAAPQRIVKASVKCDDDSFGFGVVEEVELAGTLAAECSTTDSRLISDDDGLTLPDDYDAEGLTLPADYDDGLTLAPESSAASVDVTDSDADEEDEESDTEVLSPGSVDATGEGRSEPRRSRQPRRTREDAYWDMLENWEWEEIPESDTPRVEGERPRSPRGDRGDRGGRGGGGDRGRRDRGRDERPRSDNRSSAEQRPPRDEHRPAEAAPTSGSNSGGRPPRPRSGDRPRDDRGPRGDRPSGERRPPERDDRRRDEPRQAAPASQPSMQPAAPSAGGFEDFGSGIFDEQPKVTPPSSSVAHAVSARRPREESVAQSSQAPDAVLKDRSGSAGRSIDDELVWPDEDSDVRPAPVGSVVETSRLPPAEAAGESDEMVSASDVEPLDKDDDSLRPRRPRRRRRREPRSESRTLPPDGNEGTTFDLSDALAADSESPDFIPSAVADDSAVSDGLGEEFAADGAADADRPSSEPRSGVRRRRRRRPGDGPARDAASRPNREPSAEGSAADVIEAVDGDAYVVTPIAYLNIPSWEEAIKYLLQPQLVGRNLGPDDADESLENDPRGSGGAEPTPPPPPQRRRGGGGGRGRRP